MEKFVCQKQIKLLDFLLEKFDMLKYHAAQKLIRQKGIKINSKRTKDNVMLNIGDIVEVFAPRDVLFGKDVPFVFDDLNLCIVCKPAGIEVCEGTQTTLQNLVERQLGISVFAVHRIDRNTTGLVVFAKNQVAKTELERIFKDHEIEKYYVAKVFGKPNTPSQRLVAYLKKNAENSVVTISDTPKPGYQKIVTNYELVESADGVSTLQVSIETGKTHQIRAHLAHIGLPIIGDDKYGDKEKNKLAKKHRQELRANKIIFKNNTGPLAYLFSKCIKID